MATLIRTVRLRFNDSDYSCQLQTAEINSNPTTTDYETFCGREQFSVPAWEVHLAGAQDWIDANGLCEVISDAYEADPIGEIDYEIAVGDPGDPDATPPRPANQVFRSGQCKPTADPPFGGTAGSPLTFDITLPTTGRPAKTALA